MNKYKLVLVSIIVLNVCCNNSGKEKNSNEKITENNVLSAQTTRHSLDDTRAITLGLHPDIAKLSLGWGVDLDNLKLLKQTAFMPITTKKTNTTPKVSIEIYITKVSETETSEFETDTKIEASSSLIGGGADIRMTSKTIKSKKMDDIKLVFLAESEYDPETPELSTMRLTDTAQSLKNDPAAFMNFYGNFYCSEIYKGQKLKVEATFSRIASSKLENYFQEGNLKVKFKFLGGEARNTIKNEIKRLASAQRSDIKLKAYGGADFGEYGRMVKELLLRDTSFEALSAYTYDMLENFDYSNAKVIGCTLSDYSTWGMPGFPIPFEEKIQEQQRLKKLYTDISIELNDCDVLINNPVFRSVYTAQQIETVRSNSLKFIRLRNKVTDAHKKLNKGDTSQLNISRSLATEFYDLKKITPEVFEFIASRQYGMPTQFVKPPGVPGSGFDKIMSAIVSSHIFNTSNTLTAFNHIASISFVNNYTNVTVSEDAINNVSAEIMQKYEGVNFVPLIRFFDIPKGPALARNLDDDMMNTFNKFLLDRLSITDKINYEYLLVIKDKSSRIYSFPFFKVNFELNRQVGGFAGTITHALPENCCAFMPDYEEPEYVEKNQSGVPVKSPGSINFSLKNLNLAFSDSLIIEIRTDNPLNNRQLQDDGEDKIALPKAALMNPENPISAPLEPLNFRYNFSEFILTFYSKNKKNEIDSEKHELKVPYLRKLCAQTVYLQISN